MSNPLVSLVIPCYNMGFTLDEAVASIRSQTYPHIEIIIVDDGSTDPETIQWVAQFESEGVTVVRQENGGPAAALNAGLKIAHGEFYMPLGDDLIEPPYVEEAVAAMQANPNLGIVYCRADFFGSVTGEWGLPDFNFPYQLMWNAIFAVALFRRADWVQVGGYDEALRGREDHDFNLRILGLGRDVLRLEGRYFHYRRGRGSINDAVHAEDARPRLIATYARMFRNNLQLYSDHAEDFFTGIFREVDERNELLQRYRYLERLRNSRVGKFGLKAVHLSKSELRRLRGK